MLRQLFRNRQGNALGWRMTGGTARSTSADRTPSNRSVCSRCWRGMLETSERVSELDRRIAEVEASLATLKRELAMMKLEQAALNKLKAIVDSSEVRLAQMRAERAKLRE